MIRPARCIRPARRGVSEELPGVFVSASPELSQEYREFERCSTVVANAFVGPRVRDYIAEKRKAAGRLPRRYASLADAYGRMKTENPYLTVEQARHLTTHGINRNEDGTFTWKFDPYVHIDHPYDISTERKHELWGAITCPTLLLNGADSFASNPEVDGRISHFRDRIRQRRALAAPRPVRTLRRDAEGLSVSEVVPKN